MAEFRIGDTVAFNDDADGSNPGTVTKVDGDVVSVRWKWSGPLRVPRSELRLVGGARDDWPIHQPDAPDAPIPGRHWFSACDESPQRVNPLTGVCEGCGRPGCRVCGRENCPDHPKKEDEMTEITNLRGRLEAYTARAVFRRNLGWGFDPVAGSALLAARGH